MRKIPAQTAYDFLRNPIGIKSFSRGIWNFYRWLRIIAFAPMDEH